MMELMKGVKFYFQFVLLFLASLFFFIAYGAGIWWSMERSGLEIDMTLWSICSIYGDNKVCNSLSGQYMEEVILTTRACGGITIILFILMLIFSFLWSFQQWRGGVNLIDHWLYARMVTMSLMVLFLLITLAHSDNCPPKYKLGESSMTQSIGWGWALSLTAMIFILPIWFAHAFESFQLYRSNQSKR